MSQAPGQLLSVPIDSTMADILSEAEKLAHRCPEICRRISADLDLHARQSKALRLADAQFEKQMAEEEMSEKSEPLALTITQEDVVPQDPATLPLGVGRPRTPAIIVFFFLVLRGRFGSVSDSHSWERFVDSQTLGYYLHAHSARMPGRTTIIELLNVISDETRDFIVDCQLAQAYDERLDDFQELTIDSTAIHANSAWPTDIGVIDLLINSAWQCGQSLNRWGVANFRPWHCERWLNELQGRKFALLMCKSKKVKKRRILWNRFIKTADQLVTYLQREFAHLEPAVQGVILKPSRRQQLQNCWASIDQHLAQADELLTYVSAKEYKTAGEKIERESSECVYSICDPSAAFIIKGGREKTFGYKAQFGRSANGFISCVRLPKGNAADSSQLIPMVEQHIKRTTITPTMVSGDDGYASGPNAEVVKQKLDVKHVSISGSKGRRQLGDLWVHPLYIRARSDRSAVESLMSVIKHSFALNRCHRRGIDNVRSEIMERAIAYNFWRLAHERRRREREEEEALRLSKAG